MNTCSHTTLELLPERKNRLRCRRCHLTIEAEELTEGYCPECFEMDGRKRYEFEKVDGENDGRARYRCLGCGAIVESSGPGVKP